MLENSTKPRIFCWVLYPTFPLGRLAVFRVLMLLRTCQDWFLQLISMRFPSKFEAVSRISCVTEQKNADVKLQLNLILVLFQILPVHGRVLNKGSRTEQSLRH